MILGSQAKVFVPRGSVEAIGRDEVVEAADSGMSRRATRVPQQAIDSTADSNAWRHEHVCGMHNTTQVAQLRMFDVTRSKPVSQDEAVLTFDGDGGTSVTMYKTFDVYFLDDRGRRASTNINRISGATAPGGNILDHAILPLVGNGEGTTAKVDESRIFKAGRRHSRTGYGAGTVNLGDSGAFHLYLADAWTNVSGLQFRYVAGSELRPILAELSLDCDGQFFHMLPSTSIDCANERCAVEVRSRSAVAAIHGRIRGGDVTVESRSALVGSCGLVDASSLGFPGGMGPGTPLAIATVKQAEDLCGPVASGAGAGHGGRGGRAFTLQSTCGTPVSDEWPERAHGGLAYGSAAFPRDFGSGGARGFALRDLSASNPANAWPSNSLNWGGDGGPGGGRILVNTSGFVRLDGTVSADGGGMQQVDDFPSAAGGAGSGGSVVVSGAAGVTVSGAIRAHGGWCRSGSVYSGCGAGGRVAVLASSGVVSIADPSMASAFDAATSWELAAAPGTVLIEDSLIRELRIANSEAWPWPDEVETPWPLDLAGRDLTHASISRASVRVGLSPHEPLRVGDPSTKGLGAEEVASRIPPAWMQAHQVAVADSATIQGVDLDVRALGMRLDPTSSMRGSIRARLRDHPFVESALSLTPAGRCLAGEARSRYRVNTSSTESFPASWLRDGDPETMSGARDIVFQFDEPMALSSLRMKLMSHKSCVGGVRVFAHRKVDDWRETDESIWSNGDFWAPVVEPSGSEPPIDDVGQWRRLMWPMHTARTWLLACKSGRLDIAEAEWGCEGGPFELEGLLECQSELCETEVRGQSPFHATVVRGEIRGASIVVEDEHLQLHAKHADILAGIHAKGRGPASRNESRADGFGEAGVGRDPMRCGWDAPTGGSGGGHGGDGGTNSMLGSSEATQMCGINSQPGLAHGSATSPWSFGGAGAEGIDGGEVAAAGGRGGGRIRLQGTAWLDLLDAPMVDASGEQPATWVAATGDKVSGGGGAGGSVQIRAGEVTGRGMVLAAGASGHTNHAGGGGGGGRIALFAVAALSPAVELSVRGGRSEVDDRHGAAGTVFTEVAGRSEFIVDAEHDAPKSSGYAPVPHTPWPQDVPEFVDVVTVRNEAVVRAPDGAVLRARRLNLEPDSSIEGSSFELAVGVSRIRGAIRTTRGAKLSDRGFEALPALAAAVHLSSNGAICGEHGPAFRPEPVSILRSGSGGEALLRVDASVFLDSDPTSVLQLEQDSWVEFDFGKPVPLSHMRLQVTHGGRELGVWASNESSVPSADDAFPDHPVPVTTWGLDHGEIEDGAFTR
ncbi:hypothetical protein FNF29_07265 [Cafeteria roenbergensis]|uniref:Uncharacterized protein n=1 Tax=Cafeteria roenbergensis TaxID=33653 RepID=A0A5A8C427_CAFRO|nr:hypothetical protein FNF29_07265 [Cafeteria roenbergensis]|eukprot:KAA0147618.1 hypothetical protein FNF29_07265 [Cafeteria roenbergensis]